jgi:hypothetical protein
LAFLLVIYVKAAGARCGVASNANDIIEGFASACFFNQAGIACKVAVHVVGNKGRKSFFVGSVIKAAAVQKVCVASKDIAGSESVQEQWLVRAAVLAAAV